MFGSASPDNFFSFLFENKNIVFIEIIMCHSRLLSKLRHTWGAKSTSKSSLPDTWIYNGARLLSGRESLIVQQGQHTLLRKQHLYDFVSFLLTQIPVFVFRTFCSRFRCLDPWLVTFTNFVMHSFRLTWRVVWFVKLWLFLLDFGLHIVNTHPQILFKQISSFNFLRDLGLHLSQTALLVLQHHFVLLGFAFVLQVRVLSRENIGTCRKGSAQHRLLSARMARLRLLWPISKLRHSAIGSKLLFCWIHSSVRSIRRLPSIHWACIVLFLAISSHPKSRLWGLPRQYMVIMLLESLLLLNFSLQLIMLLLQFQPLLPVVGDLLLQQHCVVILSQSLDS